jgi:hypothetical protein
MSDSLVKELREALAIAENASIPDELRSAAFICAFWAKREPSGSPTIRSNAEPSPSGGITTSPQGQDDPVMAKVASKLGASTEDLEFVYELVEGELALRVPPSRLDSVKKEAVKQIIYLVSAGRQAAGLEEKTFARQIKSVCAERGKADTNFSRILDSLHGEGLMVGGSGQSKTVRVNADGFERTAKIIQGVRDRGE